MPDPRTDGSATLDTNTRRPFGRTGFSVSPLGFGGAPIGMMSTEADAVGRVLGQLLDHGMNLIDTAHAYYGSEELIGAAIGSRRDEYVLVTKCGSKFEEDDLPPAWSPEYIRATVDRSLTRLRTDVLDVLLLHTCDIETLRKGDALGAVREAKDAGKARFIGFSGDNEAVAWAAAQPYIDVVQISVSMCDQGNIDRVLPVCAERGVAVMAKRPLANAAWKPFDDQYERYQKYARPYHDRFAAMNLDLDEIRRAADDETLEWPEIALRFTMSIPGVDVAIAGMTRPESAAANLVATAKGPLPDAAVALIREAYRRADEGWPGLT